MPEHPAPRDGVEPPEAPAADPGRPRLPDPQQDRHVAFPELTPTRPTDGPSNVQPRQRTAPTALPPDAWATQDPPSRPATAPTWAPRGATSPAAPPADPSMLSTPPVPNRAKSRRSWLPWVAVAGVLIFLANANTAHDESVTVSGDSGTYVEPMAPPADVSVDGYVVLVTDPQFAPPLPEGTALVRHSIPPTTTMLRVEVASADPRSVNIEVATDTGLSDTTVDTAPSALEVHFSPSSTHQLDVSLTDMSGDGAEPLQCRIYLGRSLLAIGTSTGSATCSIAW